MRRSVIKCVSLAFARGDTATPSGLYARLCHAFLVIILLPESRLCGIRCGLVALWSEVQKSGPPSASHSDKRLSQIR